MRIFCLFISLLFIGNVLQSCNIENDTTVAPELQLAWEFTQNEASGWEGGFADLPRGDSTTFPTDWNLMAQMAPLPAPFEGQGFLLQGHNRSNDLFMYTWREIKGMQPNKAYKASFKVDFLSKASAGSIGAGGSLAESVFLKAGVATDEPAIYPEPSTFIWRLNMDKGNQSQIGQQMTDLGNAAVPNQDFAWERITRESAEPMLFLTDAFGSMFLVVGADSAFEGLNELYVLRVEVSLFEF